MPEAWSQVPRSHLGTHSILPLFMYSVKQGGHVHVCRGMSSSALPRAAASCKHKSKSLVSFARVGALCRSSASRYTYDSARRWLIILRGHSSSFDMDPCVAPGDIISTREDFLSSLLPLLLPSL